MAANCQIDEQIRAMVAQMLRDHDEAADFMEKPIFISASAIVAADESSHAIGRMIGPYRLVREIGRGGMSVVYLAERADDVYRKRVAVKLIWSGLMTNEIARRFRQERRILARLDHPNIGHLLDGGVTIDGCQYVVMEYVAGEPITEYCDAHQLPITERLKLFQQICAAVQYAHDNLIIHRDLKPSNILVASDGTVKLLDFGIAKLLNPALLEIEDTPPSQTGLQAMTPEYASPEQARGDSITTASDVYSLGVILYELLTGHRPYRLKSRIPQEAAKVISEEEPLLPSAIISQIDEIDGDDSHSHLSRSPQQVSSIREGKHERLRARLQGDLDDIVMKAMRKEPPHRYRSASEFSEDISRHLTGEPVIARKGTMTYRASRYVRRHRVGVVMAGTLVMVLLGAIVYFVRQAHVAEAQARRQLRLLYAADMRQAGQDLVDRNLERARELIERYNIGFNPTEVDDWRGFEWYFLWKAVHTERFRLQHSAVVAELVITPDGKNLLIGAENGKIEIWDVGANRMEGVFADLQEPVLSLALSRDGKRLAAGGEGGLARVWDIASRRIVFEVRGHGASRIFTVALSSDGRMLATGGGDAAARLWQTDAGELLHSFVFAGKWVRTIQFSPDGKTLAIGGTGNSTLQLWHVETFNRSAVLHGNTGDILHLIFSADGGTLAAGTRDGFVRVWDVASRQLRQTYSGHQGIVWSVAFSPDAKFIASTGQDRTLRFWDKATGLEIARVNCEFETNTLIFSPEYSSNTVFLTTGDSTRSYDLKKLDAPSVIADPTDNDINYVAISPNVAAVATVGNHGTITMWDIRTGEALKIVRNPQYSFQSVDYSPDGKLIAVTGGSKNLAAVVELRDALTGQIITSLSGHTRYVTAVAFSLDGKSVATGSEDRRIKIWDVSTGKERLTIEGHKSSVRAVAFSSDGNRLVSEGSDNRARVWDTKNGKQLLEIESHATARFSPDGRLIATGSNNHLVKLWDAFTGQEIRVLRGHSGDLRAISFSPDGKRLASTGEDQTIRIWDPETGLELLALKGHSGRVSSLAFSRDGRLLISSSKDRTLRLWRAASEEEIKDWKTQ
ncbi:MAG: serine/threonine protein kinase [Acidobacteria bacterium]|nr:serine/threonine protein kinase [Acidobacteriota bacterium]